MMLKKKPRSVEGAGLSTTYNEATTQSIHRNNSKIKPDCSLILWIWRRQQGIYFFVSVARRDPDTGQLSHWHDEPFTRDRFGEVSAYVERHATTHEVYACPRGFTRAERKAEYAAPSTLAWADQDEADPRGLSAELRPSIAFATSPGRFQALWLMDADVSPELNQRLTYHIGADKGGWGATKVFRLIPGTINHKYPEKPRVRLLWNELRSRPPLPIAELERLPSIRSPSVREFALSQCASGDRAALIKHYASRIPGSFRSNVMSTRPLGAAKRSQILYRHVRELIEHGATDEQIFIIIEPCGFNKWAGDADALRTDIERIRAKGGQ